MVARRNKHKGTVHASLALFMVACGNRWCRMNCWYRWLLDADLLLFLVARGSAKLSRLRERAKVDVCLRVPEVRLWTLGLSNGWEEVCKYDAFQHVAVRWIRFRIRSHNAISCCMMK